MYIFMKNMFIYDIKYIFQLYAVCVCIINIHSTHEQKLILDVINNLTALIYITFLIIRNKYTFKLWYMYIYINNKILKET